MPALRTSRFAVAVMPVPPRSSNDVPLYPLVGYLPFGASQRAPALTHHHSRRERLTSQTATGCLPLVGMMFSIVQPCYPACPRLRPLCLPFARLSHVCSELNFAQQSSGDECPVW